MPFSNLGCWKRQGARLGEWGGGGGQEGGAKKGRGDFQFSKAVQGAPAKHSANL